MESYTLATPLSLQRLSYALLRSSLTGPVRGKGALRVLAASNGAGSSAVPRKGPAPYETGHGTRPRFRTGAVVFSLEGELGSGKTTFVQGLGRFLGLRRPVHSPTFLIMRELALPRPVSGVDKLYHFDWYRVHQEKDVLALGWQNILRDEKAVVAVEWGDRFPSLLPHGTTVVSLRHPPAGGQGREAQVSLR